MKKAGNIRAACERAVQILRYPVQFYKDISVRYKLILFICIVVYVPFIMLTYLTYKSSEALLRQNATQYSYDVLKMIELRFDDHISALDTILQDAVYDERIYKPMQRGRFTALDEQDIRHSLQSLIQNQPEVQSACLYTNQGNYVSIDAKAGTSIISIMPPGSSQFNTVRREADTTGGLPCWYIEQEPDQFHIFYSCAVYNKDRNAEIGFMVLLINADYFSMPFNDISNKSMENIAVISNKNVVILKRQGTDMSLLTQADIDRMGTDGWIIDPASQVLFTYAQMANPSWKVVSFVRLSILNARIQNLRRNYLFFGLIFTGVIALLMYFALGDLKAALAALLTGMRKLQNGEKNINIELNRKDEIGYVGKAFNAMSHEISVLEDWGYHEQLTRKEAEIRSLQAQINPHFLFNTLESVNWMAQMENSPRISAIITSLAALLEANICHSESVVPLRRELEYIDSYMLIMEYRFESRIVLERDIDPAVLDIEIPRLLVQPIVENAVQHGLENVSREGIIRLSAKPDGGQIHIVVEDNGIGIPPEKLALLRRQLLRSDEGYYEKIQSKCTGGIGLENVSRRIRLFYGSPYSLQIESEPDRFTRVTLCLPDTPKTRPPE